MPIVGQGSCCGTYNISSWLLQGGIHIDTSCDYGSQPTIAKAVQASGVPREQLWITSKINVESCATNMTQALYDLVLTPLQMDYVDLLLLHHAGVRRALARDARAAACPADVLLTPSPTLHPLRSLALALGDGQQPAPAVLQPRICGPRRQRHLLPVPPRHGHRLRGTTQGGPHQDLGRVQLAGARPAANVRRLRLLPRD